MGIWRKTSQWPNGLLGFHRDASWLIREND
jgi:hypothetical protein